MLDELKEDVFSAAVLLDSTTRNPNAEVRKSDVEVIFFNPIVCALLEYGIDKQKEGEDLMALLGSMLHTGILYGREYERVMAQLEGKAAQE